MIKTEFFASIFIVVSVEKAALTMVSRVRGLEKIWQLKHRKQTAMVFNNLGHLKLKSNQKKKYEKQLKIRLGC